jgi:DNA-binding transcriptional regulator GbsR (MarR family)
MSDWIGLFIILVIVGGGIYALMRANEPRRPLTEEEFQKRASESASFMSAGLSGLQQILDPSVKKAQAVIEDMRQGHYDGEQESGDGNDTTPEDEAKDEETHKS